MRLIILVSFGVNVGPWYSRWMCPGSPGGKFREMSDYEGPDSGYFTSLYVRLFSLFFSSGAVLFYFKIFFF